MLTERQVKKDMIKRIKSGESVLVLTKDYTSGNCSPVELKCMLCCALSEFVENKILTKKDVKNIFDYVNTSDEKKRDELAETMHNDIILDLDDLDDDVKFEPKKKRGRPRKSV